MSDVELSILVLLRPRTNRLAELHDEVTGALERDGVRAEILYLATAGSESGVAEAIRLRDRDPKRVSVWAGPSEPAALLAAAARQARGEILATLPGYFDVRPDGLVALLECVRGGADVAVASRVGRRASGWAQLRSRIFNALVSSASGARVTDVSAGMRVFRRSVLDEIPIYGDFHRFLPVLAERLGMVVREIALPEDPRADVRRTRSVRSYAWRAIELLTLLFLTRFTRRPLRFFGALGTLFGSLGAAILTVSVVQRFLGTPLADRPILVLGTLLVGIGVQIFTIGLLGELLVFFHAREIPEYRLAAVHDPSERPDARGRSDDA